MSALQRGLLAVALQCAAAAAAAAAAVDPVADVAQGVARASTPMLVNGALSPAARAAAAAAVAPMRAQLRNTTDCVSSLLFYEFALALLPLRDARDVFESLKLDLDCGVTPPASRTTSGSSSSASSSAARARSRCSRRPTRPRTSTPRARTRWTASSRGAARSRT